ncbi:MAG: hypothetical protein Fur002_06060 [Anaerolineales bacterium]
MKLRKFTLLAVVALLVAAAWAPLALPSAPVPNYPAKNALLAMDVANDTLTLKWTRSAPSAGTPAHTVSDYDVEISTSSTFSSLVTPAINVAHDPLQTYQTYTLAAGDLPLQATTYYWRVRANDDVPSTSAWSMSYFRVGIEPPSAFTVTDSADKDLYPVLSWTPGAQGAQKYTIQWSQDCGFVYGVTTLTILPGAAPANTYTLKSPLLPGVTYCFRIRAEHTTFGGSPWANAAAAYTATTPPTTPVLSSPANNAIVNNGTPTLKWKDTVESVLPFDSYRIQIFDVNDVTATPVLDVIDVDEATLGDIATLEYTVPIANALNPDTVYYWRMRTYNTSSENSAWTALWKFTVGITSTVDATTMNPSVTLGNVPGLDDPANPASLKSIPGFLPADLHDNVNLLSLRPTFQWNPGVAGASNFVLQVAKAPNCNAASPNSSSFASPVINVTVSATTSAYTPTADLPANTTMCWRIMPKSAVYGNGSWSDVQVFLTANPPTTPKTVSPTNASLTNDNSPILKWTQVDPEVMGDGLTDFAKYEVEIAFKSDFSDRNYPDNAVPPYNDLATLVYPIAPPITPNNAVGDPINPVAPYYADCDFYPSVHQAFDFDTGQTNTIEEPLFNIYESVDTAIPPLFSPLCGAHTYYWRVRAYNDNGEYSAWSDTRSVRIVPDRVQNIQITDCAGTPIAYPQSARPCIEWDSVYGAYLYKIQISKYANFSTILINDSSRVNLYQPKVDLPNDTPLYVRVFAVSVNYGTSLPPETNLAFTTSNPPTAPVLLTPTLNQLVYDTTPDLTWKYSNYTQSSPAVNFDYYQVQISKFANFAATVVDDTSTTGQYNTIFTPAALDPMSTYYWRVRACDDSAPDPVCSGWSKTSYFREAIDAPTNLLITPPPDLRPVFSWDLVPGATRYQTLVSYTPNCVAVNGYLIGSTNLLSWQSRGGLRTGLTYYYCVRALNSTYGPSAWAYDTYLAP